MILNQDVGTDMPREPLRQWSSSQLWTVIVISLILLYCVCCSMLIPWVNDWYCNFEPYSRVDWTSLQWLILNYTLLGQNCQYIKYSRNNIKLCSRLGKPITIWSSPCFKEIAMVAKFASLWKDSDYKDLFCLC